MTTIRDIAKSLGLSPATVSAVLHDRSYCWASEATKARIREAARKAGYIPNHMARSLRIGKTNIIGVFSGNLRENLAQDVVLLDTILNEYGYSMTLKLSKGQINKTRAHCQELFSRGCDGIIVNPVSNPVLLEQLIPYRDRTVVITRCPFDILPENTIVCDVASAVNEIIEHLLQLGHQRFITVFTDAFPQIDHRWKIWKERFPEAYSTVAAPDSITPEFLKELLHKAPDATAIVCCNDQLALKLLRCAKLIGVRVPEDISITGFDDIDAASFSVPALTTVRHPRESAMRSAVHLLLNMVEKKELPVEYSCRPRVIYRESTASPRKHSLNV